MNRRRFVTTLGAAAALAVVDPARLLAAAMPASALRLTLLHTNDVHSHIDPMDVGDYAGLGGVAVRSTLIQRIRAREKHVLLLDAGDILQGTPYFNIFRGEPEMKAMNALGYLASTIGNHEFDAGIGRLAELTRDHMKFPFLNCNYDFSNTPMAGLTQEHLIVEREGLRIGLLGVGIKLDGLVFPGYYGDTQYRDPIADASRVAKMLKNDERCAFVACLSHINMSAQKAGSAGEPGDRDLIREVPEINVVIGGHNHWLVPEPERTYRGSRTPQGYVAQAGWAGTHLGFMQFDVFDEQRIALAGADNVPVIC